jgi:uncharacterized membrane protein YcaP (DUF421 family)
MIPVARTALVYAFLLVLIRLSGKRTLAEVTVFDFITLLVMSEATQQALTGNDFSVTNAMIVVLTLVVLNRGMDIVSARWKTADRVLNGQPTILIDNGEVLEDQLRHAEVDRGDILDHARKTQAIERLEQIKWAILERDGSISIIPRSPSSGGGGGGTPAGVRG